MSLNTHNPETNTTLNFALNQTFNAFIKRWPCRLDKKIMIETWAHTLNRDTTPADIMAATQYCISNLSDWPSIYKFQIYCERATAKLSLESPIITKAEEIAHQILKNLNTTSLSKKELHTQADALLIAALTTYNASQDKPFINSTMTNEAISWRFGMFIKEFTAWMKTCESNKEFWLTEFITHLEKK